jgi:hypothetical protein
MSAAAQIGTRLAADATTHIRPSGEAFMEPTQPHSNGSLSAMEASAVLMTPGGLEQLSKRSAI